ncbi:hypothetical protein TNCV_4707781 [Trichonephila clavipes]|nr:hypothetical protein TNCV_4707781 [Trichonephila clavipes]
MGMVRKELNLGLRRPFIWTFIIADVSSPMSGADFLKSTLQPLDPAGLKKKKVDLPKSPWSSPLHVVPKSGSRIRPVGDYRQQILLLGVSGLLPPHALFEYVATTWQEGYFQNRHFKAFTKSMARRCTSPSCGLTELQPLWLSFRENLLHLKGVLQLPTTVNSLLSTRLSDAFGTYAGSPRDFTVFTDHKPLTYAARQKSDPRVFSTADPSAGFHLSVHHKILLHIPGSDNIAADVLWLTCYLHSPSQESGVDYDCVLRHNGLIRSFPPGLASGTSAGLKRMAAFPQFVY